MSELCANCLQPCRKPNSIQVQQSASGSRPTLICSLRCLALWSVHRALSQRLEPPATAAAGRNNPAGDSAAYVEGAGSAGAVDAPAATSTKPRA